jgi:hypothetical protein
MKAKIIGLIMMLIAGQALAWGPREQGALAGLIVGGILGHNMRHHGHGHVHGPVYGIVHAPPPVIVGSLPPTHTVCGYNLTCIAPHVMPPIGAVCERAYTVDQFGRIMGWTNVCRD